MAHHGREGTDLESDELPAITTSREKLRNAIVETLSIAAGGGPNPFGAAIKTLRQKAVELRIVEDPKKHVEALEMAVRDLERNANEARSALAAARRALEQFETASPLPQGGSSERTR